MTTRAVVGEVGCGQPALYAAIGCMAWLWGEVVAHADQLLREELTVEDGLPQPEVLVAHLLWFARERPGLYDAVVPEGVPPPWLEDWTAESLATPPPRSSSGAWSGGFWSDGAGFPLSHGMDRLLGLGVTSDEVDQSRPDALLLLCAVHGLVLRERAGGLTGGARRSAVARLVEQARSLGVEQARSLGVEQARSGGLVAPQATRQ